MEYMYHMQNVIPSNTTVQQENPYLLSVYSLFFHETVSGRYWLNFQQTEVIVLWFWWPLLHYNNGWTSAISHLTSYMNNTFHCWAVSMWAFWMEQGQTLNLPVCNNEVFFFLNYNQYSPLFVGFCNPKCILAQLSVYCVNAWLILPKMSTTDWICVAPVLPAAAASFLFKVLFLAVCLFDCFQ